MVVNVDLKGFEEFSKYTREIDSRGPPVFFFFSGSKLPDGNSWCPDCVEEMSKKAVKINNLSNYDEFNKFVSELPQKGPNVYFLFTGKKKDNGKSWCIYCQIAEPVVRHFLNELDKRIIFVYVDVGDREYWKNKDCPFRTDSRSKLMVIPTLIKWKGVQRLEGSQCSNRELLQMLFEDDD